MPIRLVFPLLVVVLAGAALLPDSAHASHNDFHGIWTSTDAVDGSFQVMTIGGGSSPAMQLIDFRATGACPVTEGIAIVSGRGAIDSGVLTVDPARVRCPSEGTVFNVSLTFTAQGDGTLLDNFGTTWHRMG
jgi:hypothetical protein